MTDLQVSIQQFFDLSKQEDIQTISSYFKPEKLEKDTYLQHANRSIQKLYFVKSGFIRVFLETEKKEVTQWISGPGYFLTDLSSFYFNEPTKWNMQALTNCELYAIGKDSYFALHAQIPLWGEIEKRFILKCFAIIENRVFSHLALSAEERYEMFFEHNKELFNQVPLQYIASMLGMTPETLSRIRNKSLK